MKRTLLLRAVSLGAGTVLATALLPGTPAWAATCAYDAGAHRVDVNFVAAVELPSLYVGTGGNAGQIRLSNPGDTQCGAATVNNTDLIRLNPSGNHDQPFIDLSGGPFAPGFTDEAGTTDEIEFEIDLGGGFGNDILRFQGGNGNDIIRFGSDGINLNDDDDVDTVNSMGNPAVPAGVESFWVSVVFGADDVFGTGSGAAGTGVFTGSMELFGGSGADELTTGSGSNKITGGPDNDILTGGTGSDEFLEEAAANGSDTMTGGPGGANDTANYSQRTTAVEVTQDGVANDGDPSANASAGEDDDVAADIEILRGGSAGDTLTAMGAAGHSLVGGGGGDTLTGGDGADAFQGGDGTDTMNGGLGVDTFFESSADGVGNDTMNGGGGVDAVTYFPRSAGVNISPNGVADDGDPTLNGGAGEGDNVGTDVENFTGGDGNDVFSGESTAANLFTGGLGIDRVTYAARSAALVVDLDSVADDGDPTLNGGLGEGDNVGASVENLIGGSGGDILTAQIGTAVANELNGGPGTDTENGDSGNDTFDQEAASNGNDTLNGGLGIDTADYGARTLRVVVDLDGVSDDGQDNPIGGSVEEEDNVGADIESVTGGSAADRLVGDGDGNTLTGGDGTDWLEGQDGNDTQNGGPEADFFQEGPASNGSDLLNGGDGPDEVHYGARTVRVVANLDGLAGDGEDDPAGGPVEENDTIGADVEHLSGGSGSDDLTGDNDPNSLIGGEDNDTLSGGGGADALYGQDGTDVETGGPGDDVFLEETTANGDDTFNGGDDTDSIYYNQRGSTVIRLDGLSNDGDPTANAGAGEGDNVGADVEDAYAGSGDDLFAGAPGVDNTMDAGTGNDTLSYSASPGPVTGDLDTATVSEDGGGGTDLVTSFDNVTGSAFADDLTGDGNPNELAGGGGADALDGAGGSDDLHGDAGDDVLVGAGGGDTLDGGEGGETDGDTLDYSSSPSAVTVNLATPSASGGDAAGDTLTAGTNENVTGSSSGDGLTGDGQANALAGGGGPDTLDGSLGNDVLQGGTGDDTLLQLGASPDGADVIDGGDGTDTADYGTRSTALVIDLDGAADDGEAGEGDNVMTENVTAGSGNDFIAGDGSNNALNGGGGTDVVAFPGPAGVVASLLAGSATGQGSDTFAGFESLAGSAAADQLTGDATANQITGAGGNDVILGDAGNDFLFGEDGNDKITGGKGKDVMNGGPGNDRFRAKDGKRDKVLGGSGKDRAKADAVDVLRKVEFV